MNIYNSRGQLVLSPPDVPFLTTRTLVTFLVETLLVKTPNTKTIFFNKLLFMTALTDISRGKMLTSPMKSLGSFSLFNGDVFLSLFLIVIFTLSLNSLSFNLKCVQGHHLKRAGQPSGCISSDGLCFVC